MLNWLPKRFGGSSSRLSGWLFEGSYWVHENFLKVFFEFQEMRARFYIRFIAGGGFLFLKNGFLPA